MKNWSLYQASSYQVPLSDCAGDYLEALQDNNRQITYALDQDIIYITVSTQIIEDERMLDEAQVLWALLDELRTVVAQTTETCRSPQSMNLQMYIVRQEIPSTHQVSISMQDLIDWTEGKLSDNNFASRIRYRQMVVISEDIN